MKNLDTSAPAPQKCPGCTCKPGQPAEGADPVTGRCGRALSPVPLPPAPSDDLGDIETFGRDG